MIVIDDKVFNKIKRRNGEAFAKGIRDYHNGILEIPDIDKIVYYAGDTADPILCYLVGLLDKTENKEEACRDPFDLLSEAGYDAFYADTLDKQNSISKYFTDKEKLCTFRDSSRYKKYYIINAVKKNVNEIDRKNFVGKEDRQDEYGTSVISIQILKTGGFISIKNRYNHTVSGCDNTFNSNPNNIISGLSDAIKKYFKVDFSTTKNVLPDGYVLMSGQILHYNIERNNYYYGDQCWAKDGVIHPIDVNSGDALFETFIFNNKRKMLECIDKKDTDSFWIDFNRDYGGRKELYVSKGNLYLRD